MMILAKIFGYEILNYFIAIFSQLCGNQTGATTSNATGYNEF
jgi:hypothetical protein